MKGVLLLSVILSLASLSWGAPYPYSYCGAPNTVDVTQTNFTLELVQTITRHGDRTTLTVLPGDTAPFFCNLTTFMLPSINTNPSFGVGRLFRKNYMLNRNVIPGDCNFGQLTQRGLNQHIALGGNLRSLYVDKYQFLSPTLSADEVWIRSTDIYRTVQSAQGNMQGLFPTTTTQGNVPIIDMYTMDLSNENMFSNAGTCPRYTQLFNQVVQEPAFVNYDSSFAPLKQKIAAAFGVSVDSLDWEDLFDAFNVINCYDGPLPAGITQEMVDQVYQIANWEYDYTLNNTQLTKLAIGSFVAELMGRINEKVAGNLQQKYLHYSGHDTTLAPLMTAFGVYDGRWPPYASHSQLELWSNAGQYYVQVKYQGTAFKLQGCASTMCPLSQFSANIAPYVLTNPKDCAAQAKLIVKVL